jgi:hypothetical protein
VEDVGNSDEKSPNLFMQVKWLIIYLSYPFSKVDTCTKGIPFAFEMMMVPLLFSD